MYTPLEAVGLVFLICAAVSLGFFIFLQILDFYKFKKEWKMFKDTMGLSFYPSLGEMSEFHKIAKSNDVDASIRALYSKVRELEELNSNKTKGKK